MPAPQEVTPQQYERIRADVGMDAETFKRTRLGTFILDHCARVSEKFTAELKRIDCNDAEGVRTLQNEIWKHETFELWLDEAISSGRAAMHNLERMESYTEDENNYVPPEDTGGDYVEPPELPGA